MQMILICIPSIHVFCLPVANGKGTFKLSLLNLLIGGSSIIYVVINSEWRTTHLINEQGLKWALWQQVMCQFNRGQLGVLHLHLQKEKSCYIINWGLLFLRGLPPLSVNPYISPGLVPDLGAKFPGCSFCQHWSTLLLLCSCGPITFLDSVCSLNYFGGHCSSLLRHFFFILNWSTNV